MITLGYNQGYWLKRQYTFTWNMVKETIYFHMEHG